MLSIVYGIIVTISLAVFLFCWAFVGVKYAWIAFTHVFGYSSLLVSLVCALGGKEQTVQQLLIFSLLPCLFLVLYYIAYFKLKRMIKKRDKAQQENRNIIDEWISQFSFLHSRDIIKSCYTVAGSVSGNLYLTCDEINKEKIENKIHELPKGVSVHLKIWDEQKKQMELLYRNWMAQFSFLEHEDIKDKVYYSNNQLQGTLYINIQKERLPEIQNQKRNLPHGIEVILCFDSEKFGLLIHLGRSVAVNNPSQFAIL